MAARDTYSVTMPPQTSPRPSRRLALAAQAERAELSKQRARLQEDRETVRKRLAELDDALAVLDDHERLLARLAGPAHPNQEHQPPASPADVQQLRGPDVRRVAVELLAADPTRPALHYRDWYQRL